MRTFPPRAFSLWGACAMRCRRTAFSSLALASISSVLFNLYRLHNNITTYILCTNDSDGGSPGLQLLRDLQQPFVSECRTGCSRRSHRRMTPLSGIQEGRVLRASRRGRLYVDVLRLSHRGRFRAARGRRRARPLR